MRGHVGLLATSQIPHPNETLHRDPLEGSKVTQQDRGNNSKYLTIATYKATFLLFVINRSFLLVVRFLLALGT